MIDSILHGDIALDNLQTAVHHDARWWIDRCERLPELTCRTVVACTVECERLSVCEVGCAIRDLFTISDELIDTDAFSFSFYCYSIEFSSEKVWSEEYLRRLRDDDMHIILLTHALQAGSDVHGVTQDGIVEPIVRSDIAHHHFS